MNKKLLKSIALLCSSLTLFTNVYPAVVSAQENNIQVVNESEDLNFSSHEMDIITQNGKFSYDEDLLKDSIKLQDYFGYNEYGEIVLNLTKEELVALGFTESEADELLAISESGVRKSKSRGFLGVYIHLGPKARSLGGWAAGTFAAGYVGFYCKELAALGPAGAGAAALITASVGLSVKWAVENGVRVVPIGQYVPGFNLSFNVHVP